MNQPTRTTVVRAGKLEIPEHLRRYGSFFQHGAKLQILADGPGGDTSRVQVLLEGRELALEKRFVIET